MTNGTEIIAGVGLADRPRKSRWPARMDLAQSVSGLILGLFTRFASLAGMAFVLMFYLAAPPWIGYFYAIPSEGSYLIVNKNLVEVAALAVIFFTGSGRFAGLDRILCGVLRRKPRRATA